MSDSSTAQSADEKRLAALGYKQELNRGWSGFSNFAISLTIICILSGCFTTFGQAWNDGGPIAISIGWPRHQHARPPRRALDGRARVEVPDRRRYLLLGLQPWRRSLGVVHGLVQPTRPHRHHRRRRLRMRVVLEFGPRTLRISTSSSTSRRRTPRRFCTTRSFSSSSSSPSTASSTSSPRTWCRC